MTVVDNYREVSTSEEEGDNDVRSDIAQTTGNKHALEVSEG
jgi:hypothetical protein